eukprot:357336-Chlamydomonas_euryale.AAC.2
MAVACCTDKRHIVWERKCKGHLFKGAVCVGARVWTTPFQGNDLCGSASVENVYPRRSLVWEWSWETHNQGGALCASASWTQIVKGYV